MRLEIIAACLCLGLPGCILPSPERVDELNERDEALVRAHAETDLKCAGAELQVGGSPNTLNRISVWRVEGCGHEARYRVRDGRVERAP